MAPTMNDTLQRFLFEHAPIRGEVAHLDATWRAVLERHEYPPVLRTILGELMPAGVAASLEHYMHTSEQLDTRLWLAAGEQHAAGLLLQKLPERDEPDADSW